MTKQPTLTEIKKQIKKLGNVKDIIVSVDEVEEQERYDVTIDVWYGSDGFESFTIMYDNEKDAVKRAKSIHNNLVQTYDSQYGGIVNC